MKHKRTIKNNLKSFFIALTIAAFVTNSVAAQSIIRDAEIEKHLREYSDPIFSVAGLKPKDVDIYIIGDKSLNAFVSGGQKMFLHTGIILESKTPNMLKGVIAHETGHIAGAHLARSSIEINNVTKRSYITMALGLIAMAAGEAGAGAALLASSQQFAILDYLAYSRVQEASADQAALSYLEATKQSANGIVEFFEKFRYMEVMTEQRRQPYFRSHPLSSQRISALTTRANQSPYKNNTEDLETLHQFEMMQAKIFGFVNTQEQTFRKYPFKDKSKAARYARAIAFYRAPDLKLARETTESLIREEPNNPYFQELMGQILYENDMPNESVSYYKKSVELAPNEELLRIGYARALINSEIPEKYKIAEEQLRNALILDDENAFAWNQLAVIADRQNKPGLARLATAEEAYNLGDYSRANRFAQAAVKNLERTTPSWRRAADIISITDPLVAKMASSRNIN